MIPLDHADEWLTLGARVVPLAGKNPGALLGRDWPQQATADPTVLAGWRQRWPRANLGVLPGRAFLALDVDDPDALHSLENKLGPLPPTPRYLTGGTPDRCRVLFAHPRTAVRTRPANGLELRDARLQIMAPPSVHPATGVVWVEDRAGRAAASAAAGTLAELGSRAEQDQRGTARGRIRSARARRPRRRAERIVCPPGWLPTQAPR